MPKGEVSLIVAHDLNGVIGQEGDIPWAGELPDDMRHFRAKSLGQTVLMGRVTFESIPNPPLKDRRNFVLTRNSEWEHEGAEAFTSVDQAIEAWDRDTELLVIGGEKVYEQLMPYVERMYITEINAVFEGDAYFPEINNMAWQIISSESYDPDDKNNFPYKISELRRKEKSFLDLSKVRSKEQEEFYKKIEKAGVCPFDEEHLDAFYNDFEQIKKTDHWVLTKAGYPYPNTETHLLAITRYHTESLSDIEPGGFEELGELLQWAEQEYDISSGGFAARFGYIFDNGASVNHLHVHLFKPDPDRPHGDEGRVNFKVANGQDLSG